jgi:hypothetical protein
MAITRQGLARLGEVDVTGVAAAIARLDEACWWAYDIRQQWWPAAHGATQTILVQYPLAGLAVVDEGLLALLGPVLKDIGALVAARHGGARCAPGNVLITRLPAGCAIPRHTDGGSYLLAPRRVHVPLVVNPGCTFTVAGVEHRPEVGSVYELANQQPHAAANRGSTPRLHLITDWLVDGDHVRRR